MANFGVAWFHLNKVKPLTPNDLIFDSVFNSTFLDRFVPILVSRLLQFKVAVSMLLPILFSLPEQLQLRLLQQATLYCHISSAETTVKPSSAQC